MDVYAYSSGRPEGVQRNMQVQGYVWKARRRDPLLSIYGYCDHRCYPDDFSRMVDLLFYKMAFVDMYCQFLCSWYPSPSFVLCTYQDRYLVISLIMCMFVFTDIIQYIKYGIYGNDIILFTYNVIARIVTGDIQCPFSSGLPLVVQSKMRGYPLLCVGYHIQFSVTFNPSHEIITGR